MDKPAPKAARQLRDHVICIYAMKPARSEGPFQIRRGLATIRLVKVDQDGDAQLSCDCLHDGPHAWPDAYQRVTGPAMSTDDTRTSTVDGIDEGEVGVE